MTDDQLNSLLQAECERRRPTSESSAHALRARLAKAMRFARGSFGVMRLASFIVLVVLALGVSGYAVVVYGFFPLGVAVHPDMQSTFEAHSFAIRAHIFASVIALSLGPLQFVNRLRMAHIRLHRWLGRLYLGVGVTIGGIAGLFMAAHAFGGFVARLGFAGLAVAWLYTGLRAYAAIRTGNVVGHRRWMVRNFSLTLAAVTLRLYLQASTASGVLAFEVAYPPIAWLCWVPNLLVAELLLCKTHNHAIEPTTTGKPAAAAHVKR